MNVFGSSLIGFLIAVAVLVTFHELGHYLAARWCGVRVLRFSVGFGPVLLRWVGKRSIFRGTEFAVSAIPLGGYVRMLDTRDPDSGGNAGCVASDVRWEEAFNRQPLWKRAVIVAAGPLANFLLAAVFYVGAMTVPDRDLAAVVATPDASTPAAVAGMPGGARVIRINDRDVAHWGDLRWQLLVNVFASELSLDAVVGGVERNYRLSRGVDGQLPPESIGARLAAWGLSFDMPAVVGTVKDGGPAAVAGLKPGDRVVAVNGQPIRQWNQMTRVIQASPGRQVQLSVDRSAAPVDVTLTPRRETIAGREVGRIDIAAANPLAQGSDVLVERQRDIAAAVGDGLQRTVDATVLTVRVLWGMLTGDVSLRQISGPLTMAEGAGTTLKQGATSFILFLAIVSVSIGVLNLLPVPMLDGGQLLYHFLEAIKGSPLSERAEVIGQRIGIAFVTALTALALYNDLLRIIS